VIDLIEILHLQQEHFQYHKDEITRLKGQKPKPKIKPLPLEKPFPDDKNKGSDSDKKLPGSEKREKTKSVFEKYDQVDILRSMSEIIDMQIIHSLVSVCRS
jgi:hypothetical protein